MAQYIEPFSCRVTRGDDHAIVAPRGELDMATVGAVEQELRRVRGAGFDKIVLDLSGLSFMDSSGLHLITRWTTEASKDNFQLELEPGPPAVQRIFDLAAVSDSLPWKRSE